jgi:competence protein ComEC
MQLLPILRKCPFARILVFYAAGVVTTCFFCIRSIGLLLILWVVVSLLLAAALRIERGKCFETGWRSGLLFGVILFMAGFINMNIRCQKAGRMNDLAVARGYFILQIADVPEEKEHVIKTTSVILGTAKKGTGEYNGIRLLLYIEKDTCSLQLKPGDRVVANALITGIPSAKNPGEFDYRNYMGERQIYKQTYLKSGSWKLIAASRKKSVRFLASHCREELLKSYHNLGLNRTLYGILAALTLGYRNDLEIQAKQAFSRAGVMHVMALSGFNVAIIALAFGYILGIFDRFHSGRILKTIIIILVIWLFAFITGLSPSVTRAAVMISFVMLGQLINRRINTYNILFASAVILLTITPALLTNVSFQLSFMAVLGIVLFQPIFYRLYRFKYRLTDMLWRLFTVSCAAQLSTLPLTLFYFHQFPVYFWLTNLYVVPWVSAIIVLAGFFLLSSFIPPVALPVGKILALLLEGLYRAVSFTEILPCALVENLYIGIHQAVLLALSIFMAGFYFYCRKFSALLISLCLFLVFQLTILGHNMQLRNQQIFVTANLKGFTALNFISGRNGIMWVDSLLLLKQMEYRYALSGFWIEHGVSEQVKVLSEFRDAEEPEGLRNIFFCSDFLGGNLLISLSGHNIVLLRDDRFYTYRTVSRLKTDLVVVTGSLRPDPGAVLGLLDTERIILDSSVRTWQAAIWKNSCDHLFLECWNVMEKGAFLCMYNKRKKRD